MWTSGEEAYAIPFATPEDAWKYVEAFADAPQDEDRNELTSWDGQDDLDVWYDDYDYRVYQLKARTVEGT